MYRVSGVGMGKWEGAGEVVRKSLSLSQLGDQHQRRNSTLVRAKEGKGCVGQEEKSHTSK